VASEQRVGVVPASIQKLIKLGFEVLVEPGAGAAAGFADEDYRAKGAVIAAPEAAWAADVVAKVHPPTPTEVARMQPGALLISLLMPDRNEASVEALVRSGVHALALERIPRISRAQKMDVLSSMANIAGHRAVLEAATALGRFLGAQVTAAGTEPPAKVLVIGAGVAGLAAIAAARALGAEVRAFDVRAATREQVESLGATFLQVELVEDGEGSGGYAKEMSKAFIEAEMALFRQQAREVDIVITTARVPGKRAPLLFPRDVLECLAPGSVVVDLAADQGGNCALCEAGKAITHNGIRILGYTDLESRMAPTASRFFSANVAHLLDEMCAKGGFRVDLANEIVRAALVVHAGAVLEPPPAPQPVAAKAPTPTVATGAPKESATALGHKSTPAAAGAPSRNTKPSWVSTALAAVGVAALFVVGRYAPSDFLQHFTVFVLACFVGWQVVWSVSPALHTPLMSVTNAISGIIVVGGILKAGSGDFDLAAILGAVAIFVASINIFGGFAVTQRMLRMFHKGD
jgi:NAD(P) transhydrogenase subunit alpha